MASPETRRSPSSPARPRAKAPTGSGSRCAASITARRRPASPGPVGTCARTASSFGPHPAYGSTPGPSSSARPRPAIPQPPRYGGNRPKHAQIIRNAVLSASGLCIAMDEIQTLDQSIDNEEAARLADDLSRILRSLKRIQSLLKKEA